MYTQTYLLTSYCILSILVTVINKWLVLQCNSIFFILASQSIISLILLNVCRSKSIIEYREYDNKYLLAWIPIIALLTLSIYSGYKSVQYLPITLFNIFKNINYILVAIGDAILYNKRIDNGMWIPFSLIIISIIYEASYQKDFADLFTKIYGDSSIFNVGQTYDINGVVWTMINCITCSLYTLYMKHHRILYTEINSMTYVYYNTLLSTPIFIGFFLYYESLWSVFSMSNHIYLFVSVLFISSILTILIAYVISNIMNSISATKYAITMCLNKLPMNAISMLLFEDEKLLNRQSLAVSIILSTTCSIYYIVNG